MTQAEVDEINRVVTEHWNKLSEEMVTRHFNYASLDTLPQGVFEVRMGELFNDLSKVCKVTK